MKTILTCAAVALVATGCGLPEISTELDPGGSPKYTVTGTGSNISARLSDPQAMIKAGQKTIDREDLDRMLKAGGPGMKGS